MFCEDRIIFRGFPQAWPTRSPDLNPLEYWFWETLRARAFHVDSPRTAMANLFDKWVKIELIFLKYQPVGQVT